MLRVPRLYDGTNLRLSYGMLGWVPELLAGLGVWRGTYEGITRVGYDGRVLTNSGC
jgi:hypothetical protein